MKLKFIKSKPFLILSLFYLLTRLINILKLPIFNDEAIYIDWGYRSLTTKGMLFYSLFDGKPPLMMWIFEIFHKFIPDPLLAGRMVSVMVGFLTLLGIYKLSEKYFGEKVARIAGLFYTIIPIFVFFDRQALMESSLCAIGVWSIYYFLELIGKPSIKSAIILGIIWGLGIFVKQSALIFVAAQIVIFIGIHLKKRDGKFNVHFLLSLFVSQAVLLPLYFQKNFWASLSSASRFAMSFKEIFTFPINTWLTNLKGIFMIPFWYFSPFILLLSIYALFIAKDGQQKRISFYWLICFLIVFIFSLVVNPRYLVPFLPLGIVLAAHALTSIKIKKRFFSILLEVFLVLLPFSITTALIFSPVQYFGMLKKVTSYSQESEYVSGWTSGYATKEAVSFVRKVSEQGPVVVGVRLDAGNPESAVFAYFNGSKIVLPVYFDSRIVNKEIMGYDCFSANYQFYFIARDDTLAGMDKFLTKIAVYPNPIGDRFVGVYTLKSDCKNNILNITF